MLQFSPHSLQKILLLLSLFFAAVSLGYEMLYQTNTSFPEGENNIVFSLDVSQSMNVADMGVYNRLDAAKRKIIEIMNTYPGNNYAIHIFAGEAIRILPFTNDTLLVSTFLLGLDSTNLSKQGTNLSSALLVSSESFNELQSGKVILISDGSDERVDISSEIKNIYREKNLDLIVLGVGTLSGGFVPSENPLSPYKIYNGSRVVSSLNEQSLESLAEDLSGTYRYINDFTDFSDLGNSRKAQDFSYIFLLFLLSWAGYLGLVYRSVFVHN